MEELVNNKLLKFLIDNLNKLYCVKSHLAERLPEISDHTAFSDIKSIIVETTKQMDNQVSELDEIYSLLNSHYSFEECATLVNDLEHHFIIMQSQSDDQDMRNLYIAAYIYFAESVETACINVLQSISIRIVNKNLKHSLLKLDDSNKIQHTLLHTTANFFGR